MPLSPSSMEDKKNRREGQGNPPLDLMTSYEESMKSSLHDDDNDDVDASVVASERYQRLLEAVKRGDLEEVEALIMIEGDITPLLRAREDLVRFNLIVVVDDFSIINNI